ncbi:hypothetical protein BJ944DRAFT_270716 [Cunninghamella echinulata]|nr:hypothetical protein BJ944DRAFT_270716 [Cunninghamella echinulata]
MIIRYNRCFINIAQYYYSTKQIESHLLKRLPTKQRINNAQVDSKQLTHRAQKILQSRWKDWIHHSKARRLSTTLGLNTGLYIRLATSFVKAGSKGQLVSCEPSNIIANINHSIISYQELENHIDDRLLSAFFDYAYSYLPGFIQQLKKASQFSTVTWYPQSQNSHRTIYIHTINSNQFIKLYHNILETSTTMYCGNQQLIDSSNNQNGIKVTTINDYFEDPLFKKNQVSAFILDNIEKCTNQHNGWRWTNALFNIPLKTTLHLLLNHNDDQHSSMMTLLLTILKENDQESIVQHYTKPYQSHIDTIHLIHNKLQQRDCIIIKNRHELFQLKDILESDFGLKCSVLYSELPLVIQLDQIKSYNESKKDVLLVTENMDLPFKINVGRLVFKSIKKNQDEAYITINKLQQIISSFDSINGIGCYRNTDVNYLQKAIAQTSHPLLERKAIGILPPKHVFKKFHQCFSENQSMSSIMDIFKIMTNVQGKYFMCDWKDQMVIADSIEHIPLTFEDRWEFLNSPVNTKLSITIPTIQLFGVSVSSKKTCDLKDIISTTSIPNQPIMKTLDHLVHQYHIIEWYRWFKLKYPSIFISDDNIITTLQQNTQLALKDTLDLIKPNITRSTIRKKPIEKAYLQVKKLIRQH